MNPYVTRIQISVVVRCEDVPVGRLQATDCSRGHASDALYCATEQKKQWNLAVCSSNTSASAKGCHRRHLEQKENDALPVEGTDVAENTLASAEDYAIVATLVNGEKFTLSARKQPGEQPDYGVGVVS
uniref:MIR domain-containing protein n=1 Tax=Steinernema glaseri TaxID=37863 RepID=A0A1I8AN62_9BILA